MTSRPLYLCLLAACGSGDPLPDAGTPCTLPRDARTVVDPAATRELVAPSSISAAHGIFDPSLLPAADGTLLLAYSVVPSQDVIYTEIARSTDGGATFTPLGPANAPRDLTVADATFCAGATPCAGRIIHETASLVEDADDVPAQRFKLFTHAYAIPAGSTRPFHRWGLLEIAAAPAPQGPWAVVNRLGWPAPGAPAEATEGASASLADLEGMGDCGLFTEPGARVKDGVIDLALGCVTAEGIRVVRLRSSDHARTFAAAGTILTEADGTLLGSSAPALNAADLFTACGRDLISVSPTGVVAHLGGQDLSGYAGCLVLPLDDDGSVLRDDDGAPQVVRSLAAPGGTFTGACTFREQAPALGYLVPEAVVAPPAVQFHVYASGLGP